MLGIKKVVIIGPESTGKTTLGINLAAHYKTICCPEYAREYLLEHGVNDTYNDLLTIAKGQWTLEEAYSSKVSENPEGFVPLLFLDTDMYVMKVWCEFVFGKCHAFILEKIAEQKHDLYLLCNVDVPWVKDELREYPDLKIRAELYNIYRSILIDQNVPWVDVSGDYDQRMKTAVKAIDKLLI